MVSKPRVISRSGKDVTGTSAASRRSSSSSSSSSSKKSSSSSKKKKTIKAGSGGYSPLQDRDYKKDLKKARKTGSTVDEVRKSRSSSSSSKKKNTSVSPMARKGTSSKKDPRKIKTTAERQKEARKKAGGGKDYSDIPEGTAVSQKKQREALGKSYRVGKKRYETEKKQYEKDVNVYAQQYGISGLTPEQRDIVDYSKLFVKKEEKKIPDKFDIESGETSRFAGQETRIDVQRDEQARREQQIRAQEAMRLPSGDGAPSRESLLLVPTQVVNTEQTARAYESKVESVLKPLTESKSPLLQYAGGAAEMFAYAPTAIPRLAFGLARDPKAVAKETAQSQIEILGKQPARGLGQISAMLVGPKIIRGATKIPGKFPYRLTRTGTDTGILLKTEMPVGSAAEVPKAPTQYTIPTLESAPKGIAEPMRGKISGKVSEPVPKQPGVFTGRETQPGIVETFVKTTPEQLQQLQRRGVTFQDKGFGSPIKTDYGSFRVVEPFGKGKPGKAGPIQPRITGPEPRGRKFPFRIERKQGLTPAEIGFTRGRTQPGNVVSTTAREVQLIEGTGRKGFFASEEAQLAPTRTRAPTVSPEFMKVPETAFKRKGGKVAVRERTTDPMKSDLQSLLTQSERMGRASTGKRVFAKPTVRTRGRSATFPLPFAQRQPITGTRKQPFAIPKVPEFKPQTRSKPFVSTSPTTSGFTAPEFKTTTKTSVTTTSPARGISTPKPPIMPEIKIPKLGRKRKETGKKKGGKRTGFEFYDIENPLAGFEQVFKGIGGRKK
jgi:hypothetical protein